MDNPTDELEREFEKVLANTDMLLTQRQKMWQAFKAGAEWTMNQIQKTAIKSLGEKKDAD